MLLQKIQLQKLKFYQIIYIRKVLANKIVYWACSASYNISQNQIIHIFRVILNTASNPWTIFCSDAVISVYSNAPCPTRPQRIILNNIIHIEIPLLRFSIIII